MWLSPAILLSLLSLTTAQSVYSTLAEGPGLYRATNGRVSWFAIHARDQSDRPVSVVWDVTMTWINQQAWEKPIISRVDFLNGTQLFNYTPALADPIPGAGMNMNLEIQAWVSANARAHIPGSPFSVWLSEWGPLDPQRTILKNVPTHGTAGQVSQFFIIPKDTNGNTMTEGSEHFLISLLHQSKVSGTVTVQFLPNDQGGQYLVEFMSTSASFLTPFKLEVQHVHEAQGRHLEGSPFDFYVAPGPVYPPMCEAKGVGIKGGIERSRFTFLVQEVDQWGNDRGTNTEGAIVTAYFADGFADVSITKNNNGSWTCSYLMTDTPEAIDRILHVKINGVAIADSPFTVHVFPYVAKASPMSAVGFIGAVLLGVGAYTFFTRKKQAAVQPDPQKTQPPDPFLFLGHDFSSESEGDL